MGNTDNITATQFPKQGSFLNKRTKVCFHYDMSTVLEGTIVHDDVEKPFCGIVKLDDGRYILMSECQYSPFYPY